MVHQEYTELPAAGNGKPGASFYAAWVILTTLCLPVAFFLGLIVLRIITNFVGDFIVVNGVQHITEDYLGIYVLAPLAGLLTGTCQYFLLRTFLPGIGVWVWATLGGWILGLIVIVLPTALNWTDIFVSQYTALPAMGLSIGLAQWLVLRRRFHRAGLWIVANLLGWGILAVTSDGRSFGQFGLFALAFFPACATALLLWWLLRQAQPGEKQA